MEVQGDLRKPERKPHIATQQAEKPAWQRLATSRNRVLRGVRATGAAKRTQDAWRAKRLSPDTIESAGADAVDNAEGSITTPNKARCRWSRRGPRTSPRVKGLPRNLGDPVVSTETAGPWEPDPIPDLRTAALRAVRGKNRSGRWYLQAKATKCGGMGGGESERSVVPRSRGTHPRGPGGGKGAPGTRNCWRERHGDTDP